MASAMGLMVALFLLVMIQVSSKYSKSIDSTLRMTAEKHRLIADLVEEKARTESLNKELRLEIEERKKAEDHLHFLVGHPNKDDVKNAQIFVRTLVQNLEK